MQDTLLERSVHSRADDICTSPVNTAAYTEAIEEGIAQTLAELDAEDPGQFDLGSFPLDGPDMPPTSSSGTWSSNWASCRRRMRRRDDSGSRLILMAMLISALLALGLIGFAVTEGYIP